LEDQPVGEAASDLEVFHPTLSMPSLDPSSCALQDGNA